MQNMLANDSVPALLLDVVAFVLVPLLGVGNVEAAGLPAVVTAERDSFAP